MAQFEVHRNRDEPGYLLNCQSDTLSDFSTRLVVPLLPADYAPLPYRRLNPTFTVSGEAVVMMTHFAISLPERELGEVVGSLASEHTIVMNAFDMLLSGY